MSTISLASCINYTCDCRQEHLTSLDLGTSSIKLRLNYLISQNNLKKNPTNLKICATPFRTLIHLPSCSHYHYYCVHPLTKEWQHVTHLKVYCHVANFEVYYKAGSCCPIVCLSWGLGSRLGCNILDILIQHSHLYKHLKKLKEKSAESELQTLEHMNRKKTAVVSHSMVKQCALRIGYAHICKVWSIYYDETLFSMTICLIFPSKQVYGS